MRSWQNADFARKRANFIKPTTIGANSLLYDTTTYIFMKSRGKSFIVFIAKSLVILFSKFFNHRRMKFITQLCHHFIALRIRLTEVFAEFALHPLIDHGLKIFIW